MFFKDYVTDGEEFGVRRGPTAFIFLNRSSFRRACNALMHNCLVRLHDPYARIRETRLIAGVILLAR